MPSWARSSRRSPAAIASSCAGSGPFRSSTGRPAPDAIRAPGRMSPSTARAFRSSRPARRCASASTATAESACSGAGIANRRRVIRTRRNWIASQSFAVTPGIIITPAQALARPRNEETGSMIRTFLKALILVPIAVLLVLLALANRLPLFLIILLTLMLGVIVGGIAAWLGQRRWRRAARRLETELREARADAQAWKNRVEADQTAATALTPLTYRPPPAACPAHGHAHHRRRRHRPRADLSGAGRGARAGVPRRDRSAGAPSSPRGARARRRHAADHAGLDLGISRLQAGDGFSVKCRAAKALGIRHLSVDVGAHRRAAGGDRWPLAHGVANGRRFRARRQIS